MSVPGSTPPPRLVKHISTLLSTLGSRLTKLGKVVENMEVKRGKIYMQWLKDHTYYLTREVKFNPSSMRIYKRREIVLLNFGFNVGSELGGVHYGVVTTDSGFSNPVINVVPLGSLEAHQGEANLHKNEIYLGVIPGLNGLQSYAIPNQLRPVSKMRIISPKEKTDSAVKIDSELMDKIDKKIVSLYVKGYVSLKELAEKEAAKAEIEQGHAQVAIKEPS